MPRTLAFFHGSTNPTGRELWATDGTASGTRLVSDIIPGPTGSNPADFAPTGTGKVVFAADNGGPNGYEVYVSDGTAARTGVINSGFVPIPVSSELGPIYETSLSDFTTLGNGQVLFAGTNSQNATQLWSTDGTVAGTALAKSFAFGTTPVVSYQPLSGITAIGNGKAVFEIGSDASPAGLWGTDGTAAGTVQLSTVAAQQVFSLGNGKALTSTRDANGYLLGATNGTVAGTAGIRNFTSVPDFVLTGNGKAVFEAAGSTTGGEGLWVTDGTATGTALVPVQGQQQSTGFFPQDLTALGDGRVVFAANDGKGGNALWVTDGTIGGTAQVADLAPPLVNGRNSVSRITALPGGKALVQIGTSDFMDQLLVTDGTAAGTSVLHSFSTSAGAYIRAIAALSNGTAVFSVSESPTSVQLWRTDGTAAGTVQIADVKQSNNAEVLSFTVLPDGRATFSATNADGTSSLWATSGTAASTGPIAAVSSSNSGNPFASGFTLATVPDLDPLFDSDYYNAHNPDVAAAGLNAYQHYLAYGGAEGRSPDPFFDGAFYLRQNPDVARSGMNPLTHFEQYGWREGRNPSLLFSDSKYLQANPDVAASGIDPLQHYLQHGQAEGRMAFLSGGTEAADPLVNPAFYDKQLGATLIPTSTAASQQAAWGYDTSGWQRGLNPDAWFNTSYYLTERPDVAAAHVNPLLHFEQHGWKEGSNPSAQFSTRQYLTHNLDVAASGVDPLLHYVQYGQAEGRAIYPA